MQQEIQRTKQYAGEMPPTRATTLRLCAPWFGTGRTVIGDSWFGSVANALELHKNGLHSILMVKTGHSNFPRSLLESSLDQELGSCASAVLADSSEREIGARLLAVRWLDRKPKTMISTASTTAQGVPRVKRSGRVIPRPQVVQEYFEHCSAVDIFNHVRHGGSSIMRSLVFKGNAHKTQAWLRKVFFSSLDFAETNSFLAWKKFGSDPDISHHTFKTRVAKALTRFCLTNQPEPDLHIIAAAAAAAAKQAGHHDPHLPDDSSQASDAAQRPQFHFQTRYAAGVKRKRCCVCASVERKESRTHFYCLSCGPDFPMCVPIHNSEACIINPANHDPDFLRGICKRRRGLGVAAQLCGGGNF